MSVVKWEGYNEQHSETKKHRFINFLFWFQSVDTRNC